jgi:peroxiredoxin family protein
MLGGLPGMSTMATGMMRKEIDKLGFPPVAEFVETLMDAGTHVYGCKMSMDMMELNDDDLVEGATTLGAMEFMDISEGAQIIFV